jgi:hypothetical protein
MQSFELNVIYIYGDVHIFNGTSDKGENQFNAPSIFFSRGTGVKESAIMCYCHLNSVLGIVDAFCQH